MGTNIQRVSIPWIRPKFLFMRFAVEISKISSELSPLSIDELKLWITVVNGGL